MEKKQMPRGFRNNNPCNIRKGSQWLGLDPERPDDGEFCRFTSMTYGFRAPMKLLQVYYRRYGLHSVKAMISRWAPESENNTRYYIRLVAAAANVTPGAYLTDPEICSTPWVSILVAMAQVENGVDTYDPKLLHSWAQAAWEMLYE